MSSKIARQNEIILPNDEATFNQRVKDVLLEIRTATGKSQAAFAMSFNVNPDVYRKWEQGRTIPKIEQTWQFLKMLGEKGREKTGIHLGPMLDMLRGDPSEERARAFDALAIVLEHASKDYRAQCLKEIEKWAVKYRK